MCRNLGWSGSFRWAVTAHFIFWSWTFHTIVSRDYAYACIFMHTCMMYVFTLKSMLGPAVFCEQTRDKIDGLQNSMEHLLRNSGDILILFRWDVLLSQDIAWFPECVAEKSEQHSNLSSSRIRVFRFQLFQSFRWRIGETQFFWWDDFADLEANTSPMKIGDHTSECSERVFSLRASSRNGLTLEETSEINWKKLQVGRSSWNHNYYLCSLQ